MMSVNADSGDLAQDFEKAVERYHSCRDVDLHIRELQSIWTKAARRQNQHVVRICKSRMGHLQWAAGRLERALRHYQWLARRIPEDLHSWVNVLRLQRALGRFSRALALADKALARLGQEADPIALQQRAEICFEAGLSAHLAGDYDAGVCWLDQATVRLPKRLAISDRNSALMILGICRLARGDGSIGGVGMVASKTLKKAKRHPIAAAALAVAAWKREDIKGIQVWRESALLWSEASLGVPFCHDNWQQTHAILRLIPESASYERR